MLLLFVYAIGWLVCSIINVHLVTRSRLPEQMTAEKIAFSTVVGMGIAIIWPLLLLYIIVMFIGLWLTKARQKRE